ncbi:baseplate J/gp47 family protein [uncultured Megasphaera sp.]|uniref:baseplate assembly protein n=1 Tax=uncultured Megasphaera sp. TaxID=165188 RepID=UPI0026074164|nr:baseplate J/gp47 family protein [uncultured Megasphaera sp.]
MKLTDLPDIEFVDANAEHVKAALFADYISITGRTLAQGDPVRLFLLVVAEAFIRLLNNQNYVGKQNLLRYATGDNLDHLGALTGTTRIPASAATTTIKITLSAARNQETIIPAGTRVVTASGVYFAIDDDTVVLAGGLTVNAKATCQVTGELGNGFLPGEISNIVDPVAYVATMVNLTASAGGADKENDDAYRERIHESPERFSTAGPTGAYEYWAKSANSAISDVTVYSPSAGVVEIRPLLDGGKIPEQEVLDVVDSILNKDTVRPLTDQVQVKAPEPVSYDISLTYYSDRGASESMVKDAVMQAITGYERWQSAKIGRDINPSRLIADVMSVPGVKRVIVTSPTFTKLTNVQVAQAGTVTASLGGSEDE